MKKIFITIATVGLLGTTAFAKVEGKKAEKAVTVNYSVQNAFDSPFNIKEECNGVEVLVVDVHAGRSGYEIALWDLIGQNAMELR